MCVNFPELVYTIGLAFSNLNIVKSDFYRSAVIQRTSGAKNREKTNHVAVPPMSKEISIPVIGSSMCSGSR